jgi:pimeloyl-ACP methyl ester carboxylesterase
MQTIETRIRHITAAMTVTLLTAMSTELVAADEKAPQVNRGYAPVNGLKMYYELHGVDGGKNPPLVLLHGGGSTIDTTFGKVLPSLAKSRQVVAFEQQGHGRTGDMADRPFSFEQSADDTVALMDHLKIEKADLFGFSNGGNIALQIAIRHPNRVRKLVVASAMFKRDGLYPEVWEFMKRSTLEDSSGRSQTATLGSRAFSRMVTGPSLSGAAVARFLANSPVPTGRTFTLRGCGFFQIVDGKIRSQRGYWDRATWFNQLGLPID